MHPEKIQLDQIKNGRRSAIIYFDISQKKKLIISKNVNLSPTFFV